MPTERDLNAAIARRHLEDLRAIFGDNEQVETLSRLLTWSRREWTIAPGAIAEELLGG